MKLLGRWTRKPDREKRAAAEAKGHAPALEPRRLDEGLRMLLMDGVSSQVMGSLTGGALLVAFALLLGASNTVIGIIAAVGPLTQLLQIPAILLVEKIRRRKSLVILSLLVGRSFWVLVAAIPWVVPAERRVAALLVSLVLFYAASNLANSAFNSWKRDLVPDAFMGRFFAKRLTLATMAGAAVTLASGFFIDHGGRLFADPVLVYSPLFLLGGVFGLLGVGFLGRVPEPPMALATDRGLVEILTEPARDENFRKLLLFLASWNFAINLAAPFFSVYLLVRLEMPMAWVLGLAVLSQIANITFFRIWGRLADRMGNKAVLSLSGWLFVVSIAMWPFTTLPERYLLTIPLLLAIHVLAGISTAGVNLCAGSITLKLAPRGKATAFLATNALTSGLAATVAPALAGIGADWLQQKRLSVQLDWSASVGERATMTVFDLSGLDFLFLTAVVLGLYALHRLLAVREAGTVEDVVTPAELYGEVRRAMRNVSTVAGLRRLTDFPYALLRTRRSRRRPPDQGGPSPG